MSNHPLPVQLSKTDDRCLVIAWDDQFSQAIPFRKLRNGCCCATCNDLRAKAANNPTPSNVLPILSAAEAQPLDIIKMQPVGNYAYNIHFSDGHSSGIFTYELLRSFG